MHNSFWNPWLESCETQLLLICVNIQIPWFFLDFPFYSSVFIDMNFKIKIIFIKMPLNHDKCLEHLVILNLKKQLANEIFITYNQPAVNQIKRIADQFNRTKMVYFNQTDSFANKIQLK